MVALAYEKDLNLKVVVVVVVVARG